jgi:hypothetical protein
MISKDKPKKLGEHTPGPLLPPRMKQPSLSGVMKAVLVSLELRVVFLGSTYKSVMQDLWGVMIFFAWISIKNMMESSLLYLVHMFHHSASRNCTNY